MTDLLTYQSKFLPELKFVNIVQSGKKKRKMLFFTADSRSRAWRLIKYVLIMIDGRQSAERGNVPRNGFLSSLSLK